MKAFSSLRSRIFVASALLAVLSIGAAIYVVSVRATREAENGLQHEILATRAIVEQLHQTRTETFAMRAKLIAGDPRLKAAVDTNDPATVQSVANEYADQVKSNMLLVTHRSGGLLAAVGALPGSAQTLSRHSTVRQAIAGRDSFSLLAQPGGMLQLVTVPIAVGLTNPDILGTLSVGFLLDDDLATQLKAITGSEIAFALDGQILATTLPLADRPALAGLAVNANQSTNVMLRTGEYVVLPLALPSGEGGGPRGSGATVMILRSRTEHLRFLRTIHTELAFTAVAAVLLATLLSFVVARTITRPLAAITDVMREVADTGDLTRKIVLRGRRWDDEDARLLAATFNTLTDSVARFQREISQKERLSSLGRLSTVIAHEVRNPLMIIKAALHALSRPGVGPATLREAAVDIDEEVARLNRIVNEVLDFARPIRFEFAPADLNALCRESAAAAQATEGAPVVLDLDPALGAVPTDAERLRVALINLIVNARQAFEARGREPVAASPAGVRAVAPVGAGRAAAVAAEARPRVVVSTRADRHSFAILVADNGVGIDQADLSRVFDPYFTTKRGGTGLGLPIAKNIIDGLGGTLTITSATGGGTEMRVDLPYTPPHS